MMRSKDETRGAAGREGRRRGAMAHLRAAIRPNPGRRAWADDGPSPSSDDGTPRHADSDMERAAGQMLARLLPACGV